MILSRRFLARAMRYAAVDIAAWALVALAFAAQGYVIASYRGAPQPWWPSLGYALAIFSVWALLTPMIIAVVWTGQVRWRNKWARAVAIGAGLPIVAVLHVAIFALLFWPVYKGVGVPTRAAMAERMALRNFDTNALFYLLVVGTAFAWANRIRTMDAGAASGPNLGQTTTTQSTAEEAPLQIRSRGRIRLLKPGEIDWIGAAGDYAEVHAAGHVHLIEASLVALERHLPEGQFARIHRGTLVRLDRITEVRGLGRGDASVQLEDGTKLRLSRRYRANVAALVAQRDPARPLDRSRLPIGHGTGS